MADSKKEAPKTAATATDDEASRYKKNLIRGIVTNVGGGAIIYGVSTIRQGIWLPAVIALGIQHFVFFFHGLPYNSEKYYDLSGSFTHFAVVAASMVTTPGGASARQVLFGLLSTVWMIRLGTFLYIRILRDGRDERFQQVKKVWLRFLGAWTLQACWVVLVQMPIILISSVEDTTPMGWMEQVTSGLALLLWIVGFLLEAIADVQKFAFRQVHENRNKYIVSGLWRYARHPNYFGEIVMWVAAAAATSIFGFYSDIPTMHFAWLSPVFTALLLLKLSGVPMVQAAGQKKWGSDPAYQHYMKNTSMLVPWFPATASGKAML